MALYTNGLDTLLAPLPGVTSRCAQAVVHAARVKADGMETRDVAPLVQPGGPLYGIEASNDGRLIVFAGGIPLKSRGRVVGAVGVSGGTVEQD